MGDTPLESVVPQASKESPCGPWALPSALLFVRAGMDPRPVNVC